jgi:hypothetical protein
LELVRGREPGASAETARLWSAATRGDHALAARIASDCFQFSPQNSLWGFSLVRLAHLEGDRAGFGHWARRVRVSCRFFGSRLWLLSEIERLERDLSSRPPGPR